MAGYRFAGSQCRYRLLMDIDPGTLCRQATPPPGPTGSLSLWPELHDPEFVAAAFGLDSVITDSDKAEFKLIQKMPALDNLARRFRSVRHYVSFRTMNFGSPSVYADFASESDTELTTNRMETQEEKADHFAFHGYFQREDAASLLSLGPKRRTRKNTGTTSTSLK